MTLSSVAIAAPTSEGERLYSLDVLRGFALCGILLMNIPLMGGSFLTFHPLSPPSWSSMDWRVFGVGELFVEGTMRGTFSLLFGAGVLLITARGMQPDGPIVVADVHYRRAFMLMALGVVHFTLLLWPGEILFNYGLVSLCLFPLRRLPAKWLAGLAAATMAASIAVGSSFVLSELDDYRATAALSAKETLGQTLTAEEAEKVKAFREQQARPGMPDPDELKEEAKARSGVGYGDLVAWSAKTWAGFVGKFGPLMVLDTFGFMCAGMALFKWGVLTGQRSIRLYVAMAALGYGLGVPINAWQLSTTLAANFTPEGWPAQITYDTPRLLVTLGHLGLVLTLVKLNALGIVGRGLANMGRMALSNYVGQSVITAIVFYGLGLWMKLSWLELWAMTAAIWLFQGVVSTYWLKAYTMGPMEWLLRAGAYGRFAEIRRGGTRVAPAAAE
jgi:uncharacterized protein